MTDWIAHVLYILRRRRQRRRVWFYIGEQVIPLSGEETY